MNSSKCFYLFNCDKTYDLDVVEKLLDVIKTKTTGIDIQSKKEYFRLHHMPELTKTIDDQTSDGKMMDYAIFAVNAHESRLSINEDNAGIGYANIYRALLRATDERVIVVIGGDDNYRNASEEDGSLLSRWARRKVSSQFKEEFMDGTKGFIFSWDTKHKGIHEEALLHFLDSKKKGQKFFYKKKPQAEPMQSETLGDQKQTTELHKAKIQKEEGGALRKFASEICQRQKDVPTSNLQKEMAECDDSGEKSKEEMERCSSIKSETVYGHFQDAMGTNMTQSKSEANQLVVLGRNQSDLALFRNLFGDEFSEKVLYISGSPVEFKDVLKSHSINSIRSCFIFLDGAAILEEFASHYKDLLLVARDNVDKKVVTIICFGNRPIHEHTITDEITKILGEKVCILWWRETFSPQEQFSRRNAPFHRSQSLPEGSPKGFADRCTPPKHIEEPTLVLKTRLRYGRISYQEAEKRSGEWTPPKGIEDNLYDKWQSAPNVELLIHEHRETGKTQHHVVVKDNQNNSIVQFLYGIAAKGISHLPFRQDRAHSPPLD